MDTRHLVDAVVAQTTILIALLATAPGIRALLAGVADQFFLARAQAVEAQDMGRKVVADMFGFALRTYQKKVSRLSKSVTESDTTLWQAVPDLSSSRAAPSLSRYSNDLAATISSISGRFSKTWWTAVLSILPASERVSYTGGPHPGATKAKVWFYCRQNI